MVTQMCVQTIKCLLMNTFSFNATLFYYLKGYSALYADTCFSKEANTKIMSIWIYSSISGAFKQQINLQTFVFDISIECRINSASALRTKSIFVCTLVETEVITLIYVSRMIYLSYTYLYNFFAQWSQREIIISLSVLPSEAEFNMIGTTPPRFTSRGRRRFASSQRCRSTMHAGYKDASKICILRTSW